MWTATPRRRGLQGRKRLALHPSHHLSYLLGPDRTGTLGVTGTWTWDPGLGVWDSGSVCECKSGAVSCCYERTGLVFVPQGRAWASRSDYQSYLKVARISFVNFRSKYKTSPTPSSRYTVNKTKKNIQFQSQTFSSSKFQHLNSTSMASVQAYWQLDDLTSYE